MNGTEPGPGYLICPTCDREEDTPFAPGDGCPLCGTTMLEHRVTPEWLDEEEANLKLHDNSHSQVERRMFVALLALARRALAPTDDVHLRRSEMAMGFLKTHGWQCLAEIPIRERTAEKRRAFLDLLREFDAPATISEPSK